MNVKLLFSLIAMLAITGCTHSIHMVHTDGFGSNMKAKTQKTKIVEARAEQKVVLFFAFDTDYVDQAKADLESQCQGNLQAVSTQFSTSHGFLHWTNKILMKGVCAS